MPISNGGTADDITTRHNVEVAIKQMHGLMDLGFAVVCPQLTYFADMRKHREHYEWLDQDCAILVKCDVLLRGAPETDELSAGCRIEIHEARRTGVPVYRSVFDLCADFPRPWVPEQPAVYDGVDVTYETIDPSTLGGGVNEAPEPQRGDPRFLALLDQIRGLHIKKGTDYGSGDDWLANLHASGRVFGVANWVAAAIRLMDIAAYALLTKILLDEEREASGEDVSPLQRELDRLKEAGVDGYASHFVNQAIKRGGK